MKKITVFSYSFFTFKKATRSEIETFESTYKKYFNYKYEISFDKRNKKMYETIFKFENEVDIVENEIIDFFVICFNLSHEVTCILTNKNYDGFEIEQRQNSKEIDIQKILRLALIMSKFN